MTEQKKKLKRMVYIYEENLDFYNALDNKSQFINDALQDERIQGRIKTASEPSKAVIDPNAAKQPAVDPRIEETKARVAAMDALRKNRG